MEKVTIVITTYNQELYIEETLKSVLNQKTDFEYKILVADDASIDNTCKIVKQYQEKFPDKIILRENEVNVGSLKNSNRAFNEVKSPYMSFLDGDDYWINENRLQMQVDFLDKHPEYTICGGNTLEVHTNKNNSLVVAKDKTGQTYEFQDYLAGKVPFVHTSSILLRNVVYNNGIPQVYTDAEDTFENCALRGEDFRFVQHLESGKMWVCDEIFSHYRIHEKGIWQGASDAKKMLETVISYNFQDKYWADLDTDFFHKRLSNAYINLMKHMDVPKGMFDGKLLTDKEKQLWNGLQADLAARGIILDDATPQNKMDILKWIKRAVLDLGLAILFVTFFSHTTSPLYDKLSSDQSMFALVGRGITEGIIPYKDLLENKGPLFFLIEAIPQFFVNGTVGIFILQILLLAAECLEIDMLSDLLHFGRKYACILKGIFLFILMLFYSNGNMAEEYDLFFLMSGMLLFTINRSIPIRKKSVLSFLFGVLTMCVILIKMNDVAGLIAMDIAYIIGIGIEFYTEKEDWLKKVLINIVIALGGGLVTLLFTCLYYWWNQSISDMIYGYLTLNFTMVDGGGPKQAIISRVSLLFDWYGFWTIIPIFIVFYYTIRCWNSRDHRRQCEVCLVIVCFIMLGTLAHGTGWRQHLMPLTLSWLIGGIVIGQNSVLGRKENFKRMEILLGLVLTVYMAIFLNDNLQTNNMGRYIDLDFATGEQMTDEVFLNTIPEEDYDSVYGIDLDCRWYYKNDIYPAYKWLNLISFISHMGENIAEEFHDTLTDKPVKWIITNDELVRYEEQLTDETIDYILNHYDLVEQQGKKCLYELRTEQY